MPGTLPQAERNGQPRNHLTPHDGRQKTSPALGRPPRGPLSSASTASGRGGDAPGRADTGIARAGGVERQSGGMEREENRMANPKGEHTGEPSPDDFLVDRFVDESPDGAEDDSGPDANDAAPRGAEPEVASPLPAQLQRIELKLDRLLERIGDAPVGGGHSGDADTTVGGVAGMAPVPAALIDPVRRAPPAAPLRSARAGAGRGRPPVRGPSHDATRSCLPRAPAPESPPVSRARSGCTAGAPCQVRSRRPGLAARILRRLKREHSYVVIVSYDKQRPPHHRRGRDAANRRAHPEPSRHDVDHTSRT